MIRDDARRDPNEAVSRRDGPATPLRLWAALLGVLTLGAGPQDGAASVVDCLLVNQGGGETPGKHDCDFEQDGRVGASIPGSRVAQLSADRRGAEGLEQNLPPTRPAAQSARGPGSTALSWEPMVYFGDLFPSHILATTAARYAGARPENLLGDPFGEVGIRVRALSENTRLRLVVEMGEIAERAEQEFLLPHPGEYDISPRITYRSGYLESLREPIAVRVTFSVSADEGEWQSRSQPVRVHAVNDAILTYQALGRRVLLYEWTLAAFVNEHHAGIDDLLGEALGLPVPIVREFSGYRSGPEGVLRQVFAIWYVLERRGITYSSLAAPPDGAQKVTWQYVRFFGDSIRASSANCIDGTILFASVLRRIGIDPLIILIPGHAFLGFYLDQAHERLEALETTFLNAPGNPYRETSPSPLADGMARLIRADSRMRDSVKLFDKARAYAAENFNKNLKRFEARAPWYRIVNVAELRERGVMPIGR